MFYFYLEIKCLLRIVRDTQSISETQESITRVLNGWHNLDQERASISKPSFHVE